MCVHNINIWEVETLQGSRKTLDYVFPRETVIVYQDLTIHSSPIDLLIVVSSPVLYHSESCIAPYLGANDKIASLPAILLDGLSHSNLRLAGRVAKITESVMMLS